MESEISPMKHRLIALLVVVVGIIWVGATMGYTIYQAHQGVPELTINEKITMGGLAVLALGVMYLIVGERAISIFDKMDQSIGSIKIYEWIIFLVVVAAAVFGYIQFLEYIESLGYKDS